MRNKNLWIVKYNRLLKMMYKNSKHNYSKMRLYKGQKKKQN